MGWSDPSVSTSINRLNSFIESFLKTTNATAIDWSGWWALRRRKSAGTWHRVDRRCPRAVIRAGNGPVYQCRGKGRTGTIARNDHTEARSQDRDRAPAGPLTDNAVSRSRGWGL